MPLRSLALALLVLAACSDSSPEPTSSSSSSGSSGGSSSSGDAAAACDPRPGSGSASSSGASSSSGSSSGGIVVGGGEVDLDSGSPLPIGRTPCVFDVQGAPPRTNCTDTGRVICCEKKDVCYEPAKEPEFCDRPYCD